MVPNEFPEDAAHLHLLLGGQLFTGDDHALGLLHLVLLKGNLNKLVAQVDKGDAGGMVAAVHNHVDSVSHFLCIVEEMYGICVVIHICSNLIDGANIGNFLKRASRQPKNPNFFHTYINMSLRFLTFAPEIEKKMISDELINIIIGWAILVVGFFGLWAISAKMIQRIGEKKEKRKAENEDQNL